MPCIYTFPNKKFVNVMYNFEEFKGKFNDIFDDIERFFLLENPCLHSRLSFKKRKMYFGVTIGKNFCKNIADDLREMSAHIDSDRSREEKMFNTYVHIFRDIEVDDPASFMKSVFKFVGKFDNERPAIDGVNIFAHDYKLSFSGKLWIPILVTKSHKEITRRSPYSIIGFQPDETFVYNKTKETDSYYKIRSATHKKIKKMCNGEYPQYMSKNSSGANFTQFCGIDIQSNKKKVYRTLKTGRVTGQI